MAVLSVFYADMQHYSCEPWIYLTSVIFPMISPI